MDHYGSEADTSDSASLISFKQRVRGRSRDTVTAEHDFRALDEPLTAPLPLTLVIPCHHIRLGDFLMLKGRPCQVIKISTSASTGQYRYLGWDLLTKKTYEDSSTIHNAGPSSVVQVMLGPIFKQYRLLDLSDGTVVAMTESGDIKSGIPVINQSGLWYRLKEVFDSGRGSVRVLVLNHGGTELVVDVKVIHGSRLDAERARADENPTLAELSRAGDAARVSAALEDGADINESDEDGKTALFHAIEKCHLKLIGELIEGRNDLAIVDRYGKTALDYAVQFAKDDSTLNWVPEMLMKKGASPTDGIDTQTLDLLFASKAGAITAVQEMLDKFDSSSKISKVNETDRLGYTALHVAAYFGKYDIAEKLISFGAHIGVMTILGGDSVLHTVVERRQHLLSLGSSRGDSLPLGEDHARVIELLLNHVGPGLIEHRRSSDNKTVREVVIEKLKKDSLGVAELSTLQQILVSLKGYYHRSDVEATSIATENEIRSIDAFQGVSSHDSCPSRWLRIQDHSSEILGASQKIGIDSLENHLQMLPAAKPKSKGWRWIHLQKNNKMWIKEVMNATCVQEAEALTMYSKGSEAFLEEAFDAMQCGKDHPGMRRPSFVPIHASYDAIFSLVVPYFDFEHLQCLDSGDCGNENCNRWREDEARLMSVYNRDPESTKKNWHEPCTLDQSYYVSLDDSDSSSRNKDQVVSKYGQEKQCILMVKQMWIWKMNHRTLITAFPDRRRDHGAAKNGLLANLDGLINGRPPASIDLMVLQMMQSAVEFFDSPLNCGLKENVLDIFQQGITRQSNIEATSYATFRKVGIDRSSSGSKNTEAQINNLCDIHGEVDALLEIKDIENELSMIDKVFLQQKRLIDKYLYQRKGTLSSTEIDTLGRLLIGLGGRRARVKELMQDAQSVELSLNNLLDMKQKQGNLHMVRDTRRRALDSEGQTKLLFVFTIVTVIFTPISFVCAFLAVPSRDFPDDGSDNVAWTWRQVFYAAVVTESITVIPLAAYWLLQTAKKGGNTPTAKAKEQEACSERPPNAFDTFMSDEQVKQKFRKRRSRPTRSTTDMV